MNDPAIRMTGLTRDFKTVRAVDDVTLAIPPGAVFGFLGPNGAGKTTMIRLLLGLLEPTGGDAAVLGFNVRSDAGSVREHTGALLEHTGLYERLSAEQNLEFYGRIARLSARERTVRIREVLSRFGLWERRTDRAGTWSRGMKQQLAIARAILHRPALLFLDEPTAGLDPVAAAALRDDLASLARNEGITIFLTTHNLPEAEKLCTLVGVINRGRLVTAGHPDTLGNRAAEHRVEITGGGFSEPILAELRSLPETISAELNGDHLTLTIPAGSPAAPFVSFLVRRGISVEEVRKISPSLEEAFLALMGEGAES